jgi:hypothetical protein
MIENQQIFLSYIHRNASFVFLVSVIGVLFFSIANNIFKYLEKISLSFFFVDIDTDPDPVRQSLDALRICQNYADPI